MLKLCRCGVLAIVLACVSSQAMAWQGASNTLAPTLTELPATGIVLPTTVHDDFFLVETMVNGSGPFTFLIDTGASGVFVSSELVNKAKLTTKQMTVELGATGRGTKRVPVAEIDTLSLGKATFRNVRGVVSDPLGGEVAGRRVDGLLGFQVFRDCVLSLDYRYHIAKLELPEKTPEPGDDWLPLVAHDTGGAFIDAQLGERTMEFLINTGTTSSVSLSAEDTKRATFKKPPVPAHIYRVNAQPHVVHMARLNETLTIGSNTIAEPIAIVDAPNTRIGQGVLRHFIVKFDQPNRRVQMTRIEPDEPITFEPVRGTGMFLERDGDISRVWAIIPDSPAEKAGLKIGDHVVSVRKRDENTVDVAVKRGNDRVEIELTYADFVE